MNINMDSQITKRSQSNSSSNGTKMAAEPFDIFLLTSAAIGVIVECAAK